MSSEIAVIGLGVMGRNIALNIADHGYRVAVHNRSRAKIDQTMQRVTEEQTVSAVAEIQHLRDELETPRKVLLMLTAGSAVDAVIDQLTQILEPGDVIIDGGNSNFHDTQRRFESLEQQGFNFLGAGISG